MTGGVVLTGVLSAAVALTSVQAGPERAIGQAQDMPRFRSSVDLVSVAAVVRDRQGRFVTDLSRQDFEIVDAGQRRPILDFRAELRGPVKLAVLMDVSGSMRIGQKDVDARQAANHLLANLNGEDQAAVFTFDTKVREAQPFTSVRGELDVALDSVEEPYGQTSLYDAVAQTARAVASVPGAARRGVPQRSAVAVITDGVDTRSRMTPHDVSILAGGIDVPVYIVAVMSGIDDPRLARDDRQAAVGSDLQELAHRTGGELFIASTPADASKAARQLVSELRHQYVFAFEASDRAGWRPLEIRTRQSRLVVKARTGYSGGARVWEDGSLGRQSADQPRPAHAPGVSRRRQ